MTNPRKFAEKIALHTQKQAEETALFEEVMRDVHNVTSKPAASPAISPAISPAMSPAVSPALSPALSPADEAASPSGASGRGRNVGVGPMRSRPLDKRLDASPYGAGLSAGAGPYLSPPADSTWRRTHSDSALHQSSLLQPDAVAMGLHSPGAVRRATGESHHHGGDQRNRRHMSTSPDGRPRSSMAVQPRASGVNLYQIQPEGVPIPTGSLPDLSNLHFPPPLHTPLDQEDHNTMCGSVPREASPSIMSPSGQHNKDMFSYPPHTSRGPSPEPILRHSPHSPHSLQSPASPHSPNSLSVPDNFRYLHACKGVTHDNSSQVEQQSRNHSQRQDQRRQPPQNHYMYQQSPIQHNQEDSHLLSQCNASSPIAINNANMQHTIQDLNSLSTYRNPQSISRPSPQNSPGLSAQYYRCSSPHSAPPSPISAASSPSYMPENNFYTQAQAALQQDLEQFSMSDDTLSHVHELTPDPGYFSTSPSQLQYAQNPSHGHNNMCNSRTQQTTPQTPNTPTSIPDIILTDDLGKELGSAINVDSLGLEDVFPSDALRDGLSRSDLEALDMFANTNMDMVTDPATEAHFRMENDNM